MIEVMAETWSSRGFFGRRGEVMATGTTTVTSLGHLSRTLQTVTRPVLESTLMPTPLGF